LRSAPYGEVIADFLKEQMYCRIWRFAWLDQDERRYLERTFGLIKSARQAARERSYPRTQLELEHVAAERPQKSFYNKLRYPQPYSIYALSRVPLRGIQAETEKSLTICAIALKRAWLRDKHYPLNLESLAPEFVSAVPIDYMDGKPIKYRLNADGTFTLYSVGEDGKDDGGDASVLPDKTSFRILWNRKDFVWPAPATPEEVETFRKEAAAGK
jgi:hypothetical protein